MPRKKFLFPFLAALAFTASSAQVSPAQDMQAQAAAPQAQAASENPLTLEEAISLALKGHPRIKGAEEDVMAGKYRSVQAFSTFLPVLTFDITRNYVTSERPLRAGGTGGLVGNLATRTSYVANNFTFNGNWTLFDFGRTYYGFKSARALEDSLREDLTSTEQGVAYDVMDSYYNMLKAQSLVKVAEESLAASDSHLKQAQAFFEVGVKPRFDVTSAEVEVNNAKVQLIQAKDAVKAARVNLNTRIGVNPLVPTAVQERPTLLELGKPMEGYLDEALKNRPDLRSLEARLESSELSVKGSYAGLFPTITGSGAYNWYKEDHTDFFPNHNIQLAVDVPIFEGFRTSGRIGEARAAALSAKYKIEDAKLGVLNDVSRAFLDAEDAKARYELLEVSVRKARENLDIAQGRYEAGVGPLIDVTDAQVSLTQAQTNRAQAFYDYHLAFSRLMRTTGTGPGAPSAAAEREKAVFGIKTLDAIF